MDWDLFFRTNGTAKTVRLYMERTGADFSLAISEVRIMAVTEALRTGGHLAAVKRYSKLFKKDLISAAKAVRYLYF